MTSSDGGNGVGGGVTSPNGSQSRRGGGKAAAGGASPWTQIVRGSSEPVSSVAATTTTPPAIETQTAVPVAVVTEEEVMEQGSGNAGKKLAWNKPSSGGGGGGGGGTVATAESGPVMGAHSWPALSETTIRGGSSTKSSTDSLKGLADGSSSSSSSSSSSVVVVSQATMANSMSPKQGNNTGNPNPISTSNHSAPNRQKFSRRTAASSSNGSLQPPAAQGPLADVPHNPSPREHSQKSGYMSQSHAGNDHPQQRNSYKNRSSNSHPRGDGSHNHHNYGGKRDHDRGHQDWNSHRNFNARDSQMQPQRVMQRYPRHPPPPPPPPGSAPFIPSMPLRPVISPLSFPEFGAALYYVAPPHPDALRGMPFVGPSPPTFYYPGSDPQLHFKLMAQIDYYFSDDNLSRDIYLRQNMDEQGWVPLKLIAGFKKVCSLLPVTSLTDNIQVIVDALRNSSVVEVQGDKVRKLNGWAKWLLPPLIAQQEVVMSRTSSGDFSNQQLPRSSSAGMGPVAIQGGSDLLGKVAN